jgi:hypothetical protein
MMKHSYLLSLFPVVRALVDNEGTEIGISVRRTRSAISDDLVAIQNTVDTYPHTAFDEGTTNDDMTGIMQECERNGYYRGNSNYDDLMNFGMYGGMGETEVKDKIEEFAKPFCKTAESNPRQTYTSKDVCTLKFHTIIEKEVIPDGYLSTACTDKNVVESLKAYMIDDPPQENIVSWPDACVGDFLRCYDVKRDRSILLRHMCTAETILKKDLPEGTTHVSVDCREDKKKKLKWMKEFFSSKKDVGMSDLDLDPYTRQRKQEAHDLYTFITSLVIALALGAGVCLTLVYRYAVAPYIRALKSKNVSSDDSMNGDSELVPIRARHSEENREPLI